MNPESGRSPRCCRLLEHALIFCGRVKVKIHRVPGQVNVHDVGCADSNYSVELRPLALDLNTVCRDRNIEILRFVKYGLLYFLLALGRVSIERGFVLDGVLELIVLVVRGNDLGANIDATDDDEKPEKHLNGAHSAPRAALR